MKVFRHFRQDAILTTRLIKYLLYAAGEIILVVVGILIALQIDNANEAKKRTRLELQYLENLRDDLITDSIYYTRTWFRNGPKKILGLQKARDYYLYCIIPADTMKFINDIAFGGIYGIGDLTPSRRTYEELLSTGSISLISDGSLRNRISEYYTEQAFLKSYTARLQSGYAKYINAVKPFNPEHPAHINDSDIPTILSVMSKEKFYLLANQELTFAYSFLNRLKLSKRESSNLRVC